MKEINTNIRSLILLPIIISLLMIQACSERQTSPVTLADSTIQFLAKSPDGINATITLCRYIDRKSGQRVDPGSVFAITEGRNIIAAIDLENLDLNKKHLLMFHIDWVDESGKSVFLKRIDLSPSDTLTSLQSNISISPGRRKPGKYTVKVYLFRELIAYKNFEVLEEFQLTASQRRYLINNLVVYQKVDKITGKPNEQDSVFTISEKGWIRAMLDLEDPEKFSPYKLIFTFNWIGPIGKSIYKKEAVYPPEDSSSIVRSSVSASPENRQPGTYKLQLFLFGNLIAEKPFEVREKPVQKESLAVKFNASLILCNIDNYSGCLSEPPVAVFQTGQKERVYAFANIEHKSSSRNKKTLLNLEWTDSKGKSVFRKRFEINSGEPIELLSSSISLSPDKRQPGLYYVRLYHATTVLAEKKFEVR